MRDEAKSQEVPPNPLAQYNALEHVLCVQEVYWPTFIISILITYKWTKLLGHYFCVWRYHMCNMYTWYRW